MRVLLADDHEMIRAGLSSILHEQNGVEIVGEASDGHAAVELSKQLTPDAVIMDISMPRLNGVEASRQILAHNPRVKVIVLSIHCDRTTMMEMLKLGACAYLLKNSAPVELSLALQAARDGTTYLSPRVSHLVVSNLFSDRGSTDKSAFTALTPKQREVLQLLAEGKTNKEVAVCLKISAKTVEAHRAQIMEKLNIHTVAGLTKYALREGLTSAEA